MKIWLIEVIHNIDVLCNIVFWFVLAFVWIGYIRSGRQNMMISSRLFKIWLIALIGVIFIPSKEAMYQLFF